MKIIKILTVLILIPYIGFTQPSLTNAQTITEAKSIIKAYLNPLSSSISSSLNNGWYNTAKPHKLGGFDITVTGNFVMVPKKMKTFIIDSVAGEFFSGGETPTILGNTDPGMIKASNAISSSSPMPKGLNIPIVPLPMLQIGVGLIKGTEVNLRYIPKIKTGKFGKAGLFGFGFKHDLLQWIPIVDKIPINLSIQAGYSKLEADVSLEDVLQNNQVSTTMKIEATTINLILSKKVLMFTPYIGLGYNSSKTNLSIANGETYNLANLPILTNNLNPIEFEDNNNLRANIGFRFNITVLALQANYTFSEYPVATLGAGISLR